MASQERKLVSHELLVGRTVVDVEVIDAGVGVQLAQWGAAGCGDRRPRLGDLIALAYTDKPGTMQFSGMTRRAKGTAKKPPRRRTVTPLRILADRHDVTPTDLAARRVDKRRLVRLADHREMATQDSREQHAGGDPQRRSVRLAHHVKKRDLADRRGHTGILCGRRKCISPADRGAERRDTIRVDTR